MSGEERGVLLGIKTVVRLGFIEGVPHCVVRDVSRSEWKEEELSYFSFSLFLQRSHYSRVTFNKSCGSCVFSLGRTWSEWCLDQYALTSVLTKGDSSTGQSFFFGGTIHVFKQTRFMLYVMYCYHIIYGSVEVSRLTPSTHWRRCGTYCISFLHSTDQLVWWLEYKNLISEGTWRLCHNETGTFQSHCDRVEIHL